MVKQDREAKRNIFLLVRLNLNEANRGPPLVHCIVVSSSFFVSVRGRAETNWAACAIAAINNGQTTLTREFRNNFQRELCK